MPTTSRALRALKCEGEGSVSSSLPRGVRTAISTPAGPIWARSRNTLAPSSRSEQVTTRSQPACAAASTRSAWSMSRLTTPHRAWENTLSLLEK